MTMTKSQYKCTICSDTYYVEGPENRMVNCECRIEHVNKQRRLMAFAHSNLSDLDREKFTIDKFDPNKQLTKKGAADANMLIKLLKGWQDKDIKILTLSGSVGIGKTHLSIAALINIVNTEGDKVYYAPATEVSVKSRDFDNGTAERYRSKLQEIDWLVLDDVGVEHDPRGYMQTFYHSVIDHRYSQEKQTLITTNLSLNGKKKDSLLKRLGDRIVSRLNHKGVSLCFEAEGQDIRRA